MKYVINLLSKKKQKMTHLYFLLRVRYLKHDSNL